MKKKKILLFIDSFIGGGAQRQLVGLAKLLKDEQYEIRIIVYRKHDFFVPELIENNIQYSIIAESRPIVYRFIEYVKYVKCYKPDTVISYLESPNFIACVSRVIYRNYRLIVSERNTSQKLTLKDRLRFWSYRFADCVVPNSYSQEEFIKHNASFLIDKLHTITNFVDINRFKSNIASRLRNKMMEIIVVATIFPPKNTLLFIEAISLLSQMRSDFHVTWYGNDNKNDEYFNSCMSLIDEKGVERFISLMPKTIDIKDKYLQADYFCLPSFYEGTPNAICEAISCSLPVACSDVCDNSIYVYNKENGMLFNPNSPSDIAEKLHMLLDLNDNQYKNYCEKSRQIAEAKLSEQSFLNKYVSIL